jgi:hypothetical protein
LLADNLNAEVKYAAKLRESLVLSGAVVHNLCKAVALQMLYL